MKTKQTIMMGLMGALGVAGTQVFGQMPMSSAFLYQGQLENNGVAVTDTCDVQFALWDDPTPGGGNQIGTTQTAGAVEVDNGLFEVQIDFGDAAFNGDARWVEVSVQCTGDPSYVLLSPRQELTAVPYCLRARSVESVSWSDLTGVPAGFADDTDNDTTYTAGAGLDLTGTVLSIPSGGVAASMIATGQVVKSLNGLQDAVALAAGANVTITPAGNTLTIASSGGGGGNTLDQAYDQGGPGAGRTITADAGAVNITGPNGLTVTGDVTAQAGIITGQGATGGGTRFGDIKIAASTTLVTVYGATLTWDSTNRQVKLAETQGGYVHFAGHKNEGAGAVFVNGYVLPNTTSVLATINANGEYLVVDAAYRDGRGHLHIYCYYDNGSLVANYFYRYD